MERIDRLNEERYNNFGSLIKIVRYKNKRNIDVLFVDYNWIFYNTHYGAFSKGELKCPYERRTYGVGYLGEGAYQTKINGKTTKQYQSWNMMLSRCYNKNTIKKHPSYKDCTVCDEWHNFQNFAQWFDDNYYEIKGEIMCLDKDIINKNNRQYSPYSCVFVPMVINNLFTKRHTNRGEYPIGVAKHSLVKQYLANCSNPITKKIYIGCYNTVEEAFNSYKKEKEQIIKAVANNYKDKIPDRLYYAMHKYIVEISD